MQDWIDAKRKEWTAQREQHIASANLLAGALKALDEFEKKLTEPVVTQVEGA